MASMSSGEATPCSISHRASRISAPWMRLPKKPITSFLTWTGRLPSERMISPTRSACFTSVWTERTTSTSGMRCAGMKKCRPIMRPCVLRSLAISLIGKLDEFEVMAQPGWASVSISANSRRFSSRSSVTVSTTTSIDCHDASGSVA